MPYNSDADWFFSDIFSTALNNADSNNDDILNNLDPDDSAQFNTNPGQVPDNPDISFGTPDPNQYRSVASINNNPGVVSNNQNTNLPNTNPNFSLGQPASFNSGLHALNLAPNHPQLSNPTPGNNRGLSSASGSHAIHPASNYPQLNPSSHHNPQTENGIPGPSQPSEVNKSRPEWISIPVNGPPGGDNAVFFAMCPHPSCIESLHQRIQSTVTNGTGDIQPVILFQKATTTNFAFTYAGSNKNTIRLKHERNTHGLEYGQNEKPRNWPFVVFADVERIRNRIKAYGKKILHPTPYTDHATMVKDIHGAFQARTAIISYDHETRTSTGRKPKNDNIPFTSAQTPFASSSTSGHGKAHAASLSPEGKKRKTTESLGHKLSVSRMKIRVQTRAVSHLRSEAEIQLGLQMDPENFCFDIPAERFDIDALTRYWNPNFVVKRTKLTDMRSYNKPQRHFEDPLKLRPWYWIKKTDLDGLCNVHEADDADDKASVLAWLEQRHDDKAQDPFWGPMVVPGETSAQHRRNSRAFKHAAQKNAPSIPIVSAPTIQQIWEKANDTSFHDYKIYQPKRGVSTTEFTVGTHVAVHRSAIQFHELVCDFRLKDAGYYTVSVFIKMPQYYVDSQTDPLPPPEHRRLWACNNPHLLRKWGYNPGLDTRSLRYPSDRTDIPKTKHIVETPIRDWLGIQILVGPPVAKESCNPQAGNFEKYRLELSRSMVSAERRITYTLDKWDMARAMEMGLAGEWCEVPLSIKRLLVPVGNATQRILIFYGCDEIHGGYAVDRGPLIFGGARLTLVQSNQDYANHGPLETA